MNRSDLHRQTTHAEVCLAFHVQNATDAVTCARRGWPESARMYGRFARNWLKLYLEAK